MPLQYPSSQHSRCHHDTSSKWWGSVECKLFQELHVQVDQRSRDGRTHRCAFLLLIEGSSIAEVGGPQARLQQLCLGRWWFCPATSGYLAICHRWLVTNCEMTRRCVSKVFCLFIAGTDQPFTVNAIAS